MQMRKNAIILAFILLLFGGAFGAETPAVLPFRSRSELDKQAMFRALYQPQEHRATLLIFVGDRDQQYITQNDIILIAIKGKHRLVYMGDRTTMSFEETISVTETVITLYVPGQEEGGMLHLRLNGNGRVAKINMEADEQVRGDNRRISHMGDFSLYRLVDIDAALFSILGMNADQVLSTPRLLAKVGIPIPPILPSECEEFFIPFKGIRHLKLIK